MKYRIETDSAGFITGIFADDKGKEFDISDLKTEFLNCYKVAEGVPVLDNEKYESVLSENEKENRIAELKSELSSTDYIQDGFVTGLMQLKNPVTFIADLISLISDTMTAYPAVMNRRAELINELKQLDK